MKCDSESGISGVILHGVTAFQVGLMGAVSDG